MNVWLGVGIGVGCLVLLSGVAVAGYIFRAPLRALLWGSNDGADSISAGPASGHYHLMDDQPSS